MSVAIGLRFRPALDVAIPGIYAWAVTVAVPIQQRDAEGWSQFFSWLAVVCLVVASALAATRLRLWSAVAVALFVSASAAVWFLLETFEATSGVLGAVGWVAFAIGWIRAAETVGDERPVVAHRIDLAPRHRASAATWIQMLVGLAATLVAEALAWNIEGRERALLGQAVTVLCAVSVISATTANAAVVGRQAAARRVTLRQAGPVLLLASLSIVGIWLTFFWG